MRGTMVVNRFLRGDKFGEHVQLMLASAGRCGIRLDVVDNTDLAFPIGDADAMASVLGDTDFVLFWDKDAVCAENLELCGYRVFNGSECIRVCDDKALTHLALARNGVPSIDTVSCPMTFDNVGYTDTGFLDLAERRFGYPMVVKDCHGSFGQQVHLAHRREDVLSLLTDARPRILQEYVECGCSDLRLEVVGGEVVAAMARTSADGDFRANATLGGILERHIPTEAERELAVRACEAVGAEFAGVDILYKGDQPLVCEVNSNAHIRNLLDCTGTDVGELILEHARDLVCR